MPSCFCDMFHSLCYYKPGWVCITTLCIPAEHSAIAKCCHACTSCTPQGSIKHLCLLILYYHSAECSVGAKCCHACKASSRVLSIPTNDCAETGSAAGNQSEAADRGSLQLELQGLSLDNVDALEPLKLNIQASVWCTAQSAVPTNGPCCLETSPGPQVYPVAHRWPLLPT